MRNSYRLGLVGVAAVLAAAAAVSFARSTSSAAGRSSQLAAGRGSSLPGPVSVSSEVPKAAAPPAAAAPAAAATPLLDRTALGGSIDAVVEEQMKKFDLPGAVVVVVHGGEVVHSRGYGYADVEARRPFDAETSVLRTASVSKLFTATAVMQLVEQGLIDLDADVNRYLDIRVPDSYPEPITMRHLLTHTAGFDERLLGSFASRRRPEEVLTSRQFLTSPDAAPRVRPPGRVISYSNHGIALAGYIVERVSGKPFEQYVDDHIHAPLGMRRSAFRDPLPAGLEHDRVRAYRFHRGRHEPLPITFENAGPAGSQFSTGGDLARFMLANLNGGELDGVRILGPAALRQLHAQAFTHHAALPGWTLGFMEFRRHGRRMIGHSGDLPGYHNQLTLVPDEGLGVFVHFNGMWPLTLDEDPRIHIVEHVVDGVLPASSDGGGPAAVPSAGGGLVSPITAFAAPSAGAAAAVAGNFRFSRYPKTSIQKLLVPNSFFRLHVRENGDGTIRMTMPLGFIGPSDWEPVGPLLYRRVGGDEHLAFGRDERGRVTHLFPVLTMSMAFERVRWYESEVVLLGLLGFSALGLVGAAVGWPAGAVVRRIRRREAQAATPGQRRRRIAARSLGLLGTSVLATLGVMLVQANTAGDTALLPLQPALAGAVGVCGVLALGLGYATVKAWRAGEGPLAERVGHSAVAVAGIALLWQMSYWNVLPF
jgi:CubicO group peptidase (beta-lactamase class C family)